MKILYLSLSPVPSRAANSVQVVKMCAAFVRAGHEVHLFCAEGENPAAATGAPVGDTGTAATAEPDQDTLQYAIQQRYGIRERFEVTRNRLSDIWILGRRQYGLRTARAAAAESSSADIVYGRDIYALLRARAWGVPIYYEAHMPPPNAGKRRMHRQLFASRQFRRLIVVSHTLAQYYRENFPELTGKDIVVAPNGADDPRTDEAVGTLAPALASELAPATPTRSVGYVGRLHAHKGPQLLIELAALLPDIDFHVVGGSDEEISHWSARAPQNLSFHGQVSQTELGAWYASFRVVLAPYRAAETANILRDDTVWGSPLKLFEYMAHGCCIIASDLPVIRELVGENEAALLCPPTDTEAWKRAVKTTLDNTQLNTQLRDAARARFERSYSRDARAQVVLAP